jgi:hypothetical protein
LSEPFASSASTEPPPSAIAGEIERHDSLGGLIHEYYRHAA